MKIVRKKLTAAEFSPANKRYLIDEDMVQTSPDGGVTWYDDPASDPRHNPLNLLPPRTGGTAQCDAAEAMMQRFKSLVDAFLAGGSILAVVNVWLGLLLFLPGVNILVALLLAIVDALFTTGVVVIEAAMTETVYDQIKCILFCHLDTDGQMIADQVDAVYDDVDDQIGGVAAAVFRQVTSAWGEVGFSNAGATGEYTGDCDDCACEWCADIPLTEWNFDIEAPTTSWGLNSSWSMGVGWQAGVDLQRGFPGEYASFLRFGRLMPDSTYTRVEIDLDLVFGNQSVFPSDQLIKLNGETIFDLGNTNTSGTIVWTGSITSSGGHLEFDPGESGIGYSNDFTPCGGSGVVTRIHLEGIGTNPFPEWAC